MKVEKIKPDFSLSALVHVMVPKHGTLPWTYSLVIVLEAVCNVCEDGSADTRRESDRVSDEFIECWRTVAEVREYVQRFDMLSVTSDFILNEILHDGCRAEVDGKIVDELMKYPREPDKFLYSIARGLNSGSSES